MKLIFLWHKSLTDEISSIEFTIQLANLKVKVIDEIGDSKYVWYGTMKEVNSFIYFIDQSKKH